VVPVPSTSVSFLSSNYPQPAFNTLYYEFMGNNCILHIVFSHSLFPFIFPTISSPPPWFYLVICFIDNLETFKLRRSHKSSLQVSLLDSQSTLVTLQWPLSSLAIGNRTLGLLKSLVVASSSKLLAILISNIYFFILCIYFLP
jgi:hypothetical protein